MGLASCLQGLPPLNKNSPIYPNCHSLRSAFASMGWWGWAVAEGTERCLIHLFVVTSVSSNRWIVPRDSVLSA